MSRVPGRSRQCNPITISWLRCRIRAGHSACLPKLVGRVLQPPRTEVSVKLDLNRPSPPKDSVLTNVGAIELAIGHLWMLHSVRIRIAGQASRLVSRYLG